MKKRVGILMGGPSPESDISIRSGRAVYNALIKKGINAISLELDKVNCNVDYAKEVKEKIRSSNIDIAFIALHGEFGEDGGIQRILEDMNIPYTGSRVDASRIGMDKIESKEIFKASNIPTPCYKKISKADLDKGFDKYLEELGLPIVVKPYDKGSSIGLYIVDKKEGLDSALEDAFKYSNKVILEEYIVGREITVGILGDTPLPIVEIIPKNKFFDFEAKYKKGFTEYISPAKIDDSIYAECQSAALKAHKALGARFFSRVDIILSKDNIPYILEVNTIPGLTETSLLPKAANEAGIDFEELTLKILESAIW
ncbi:MAG: D-alanine--D-alanine ligase [Candidatus Omnitrophota bacterium]